MQRTVAGVLSFAIFLGVLSVAALVIGVHDLSVAGASIGLTALSVVLVLIGLVQCAAAFHLVELAIALRHTPAGGTPPRCGQRVLVALGLTALLGVYVFLSAVGSTGAQRPVVVVIALLIVAVAAAGVVALRHDVGLALPHMQTAVLFTLAGTAIGLAEFWYQNQYTPTHLGRAVSLSADLSLAGRQGGYDVVVATLGYQDIGGRSLAVIGSTYSLTGSRVYACDHSPTADKLRNVFAGVLVDPQRSRFMDDVKEAAPATVIAAGKFVADGKQLQAGVPSTRRLVFFVPRGDYQLLRLRAQLFAISSSALAAPGVLPVFAPPKSPLPGDHDEYGFWQANDESWLHALVYGRRRWLAIRYELASHPSSAAASPDLRVTARFLRPTWSERPPSGAQLESAFVTTDPETNRLVSRPVPEDASEPFADTELATGPPTAATAAERQKSACGT